MAATTSASSAAASTALWADEENEICNDDGFIYRRRKRHRSLTDNGDGPSSSASAMGPEAEKRSRRAMRKAALVRLKERYTKEMEKWELVSTFAADLLRTSMSQVPTTVPECSGGSQRDNGAAAECIPLPVEELLLQAEKQEAVIRKLSDMCAVVESLCDAREKSVFRALAELPVWSASGREICQSLIE